MSSVLLDAVHDTSVGVKTYEMFYWLAVELVLVFVIFIDPWSWGHIHALQEKRNALENERIAFEKGKDFEIF